MYTKSWHFSFSLVYYLRNISPMHDIWCCKPPGAETGPLAQLGVVGIAWTAACSSALRVLWLSQHSGIQRSRLIPHWLQPHPIPGRSSPEHPARVEEVLACHLPSDFFSWKMSKKKKRQVKTDLYTSYSSEPPSYGHCGSLVKEMGISLKKEQCDGNVKCYY